MKTFVVFFSVDPENKRAAARLVLMRQFLEGSYKSGITILDEAILLDHLGQTFLVVAQAADQETVAAALEACRGVFTTQLVEASLRYFNAAVSNARYCVLATEVEGASTPGLVSVPRPNSSVVARYQVALPPGSPYSSIFMVESPSYHLAKLFGAREAPGRYIQVSNTVPLKEYFEAHLQKPSDAPETRPVKEAHAAAVASASGYSIFNEGSAPVTYIQTDSVLPFITSVMSNRQAAAPGVAVPVSSAAYLWSNLAGSFACQASWWYDNGIGPNTVGTNSETIQTASQPTLRWAYPDLVIPNLSNSTAPPIVAGFDLSAGYGFHARSALYLWLNDLMHSTKYDLPWAEDAYTGGSRAAYNYILSQIPGNVPPNQGTLKEKEVISGISFPNNGQFTLAEFQDVQKHLLLEIDHFKTVDHWFDIGGIVYSINTLVALSATNDLTAAIALMSIPKPQDQTTLILDELFGEIEAVLSAIPGYGAAVAAVLSVAWTTAKMVMQSGEAEKPIGVAVAEMADTLNHYLQYLVDSTQAQLSTLYANWGKLNEFSDGAIRGPLYEKDFFPPDSPPSAASDQPYKPQGFVDAAANAWLAIIYKKLFSVWHTPTVSLSFSTNLPGNPWNPDAGQYAFTWTLPASYYSKGNVVKGYAVLSCSTDAPQQVMQTLFGAKSRLQVNAIEFFAGLNGWPAVVPLYDAGKLDDIPSSAEALVPIVEIGF